MEWSTLNAEDVDWCVRRLPKRIRKMMETHGPKLALAGGYIRSRIAGEEVKDFDLFTSSKTEAAGFAFELNQAVGGLTKVIETDNAFTVPCIQPSAQFIHRWVFTHPREVVPSFDFSIARAAIWFEDKAWQSMCDPRYYADLAAKRLIYCFPQRNEDAGGSILRLLKFYQRGYRAPLASIGGVVARLMQGIDMDSSLLRAAGEVGMTMAITGLLREVDPSISLHGEEFTHHEVEE